MEAKFRVGDKVLDKAGQQWVVRHYDKINDNYYYLLNGKVDEVIESDLCFALPPEDYIKETAKSELLKTPIDPREFGKSESNIIDGVNGMSGISEPNGISGVLETFDGVDNNKTILDEAKEIVDGLRADDYYDPVKNFRDISVMASLMTGKTFSPADCVKVLMAVKLTRESFKHKRDSLVDLCGYTYILSKIEND